LLELIGQLGSDEWGISANEIYNELKPVLQTNSGLIRRVRSMAEGARLERIHRERGKFLSPEFVGDLTQLDQQVDNLATALFQANYECQEGIYYNFIPTLAQLNTLSPLPSPMPSVLAFLSRNDPDLALARHRLNMIISRVVNESAGQSNKSKAGAAGEIIAEAVLNAAGLIKGRDFRTQYKSDKGSDTDVVIPFVLDNHDQDVEVFVAVQLSTNDRARLASSELKAGAQAYLLTGNGLNVSKKKLQSIGRSILENYSTANYRIVCFGPEIEMEIRRLEMALGTRADERTARKLSYLRSHVFSFQTFAQAMRDRYAGRQPSAAANAQGRLV
jgi:hypothetical protein